MLDALKKTIRRHDKLKDIEERRVPVSILMNQSRQKILQFIYRYPCTHLHGIARNFGFSINTTRWHLRKLIDVGYIDEYKLGNRKVYFPNKSLDELDIKILGLLNDRRIGTLFLEILISPGTTQKDLWKKLNKKQSTIVDNLAVLEQEELIYSQKDGPYRRYYPTSVIFTREKKNRRSLKKFRKFLIQSLICDGVEPEILRTTDKKFHIRIKSGKNKSDLIFYFNPYERFIKLSENI